MSIRLRFLTISLAAVCTTVIACLLVQRAIIRTHGIQLTHDAMRGALVSAENVRQAMSHMREQGLFVAAKLSASERQRYRETKP